MRTNPENVLYNLKKAYANMDADVYLDCLAEDFMFFLNPNDVPGDSNDPLPEYWDKAEEERIHLNMFGEGTDVEGVQFVFTHASAVWDGGGSNDPLDDLFTYVEAIDLRLELPGDLTLHVEAPAEFLFHVDPDSTGPGGEILWEIWKQWDRNEEGCGESPGRREAASWGRVKARFRDE